MTKQPAQGGKGRTRRYLPDGRKVCSRCDHAKPTTDFYQRGKKKDGTDQLSSYCRDCNAEHDRVRKSHRERLRFSQMTVVTVELRGSRMLLAWSDGTVTREKTDARRFFGMKLDGARLINKPNNAGGVA